MYTFGIRRNCGMIEFSALRLSMYKFRFTAFLISICLPVLVVAQNPAKWSLSSDSRTAQLSKDSKIKVSLKAEIESGWHLYALEQPEGGPIATTIKITEGKPFMIDGKIASPKPIIRQDPLFTDMDGKALVTKFFVDTAAFIVPIKATAEP